MGEGRGMEGWKEEVDSITHLHIRNYIHYLLHNSVLDHALASTKLHVTRSVDFSCARVSRDKSRRERTLRVSVQHGTQTQSHAKSHLLRTREHTLSANIADDDALLYRQR